jgi:hypothetical protein
MTTEQSILTSYPLLLAKRYEAALLEDEPQLRVIGLVELYEEILRYLALIGLAEYNQRGIKDEQVEKERKNLDRPSLGHWLGLLTSLATALQGQEYAFQIPPLNQVHSGDAIYTVCEQLHGLIGVHLPKKARLSHFLDCLVVFRNKKIGHGSLSAWEAKQVMGPLQDGLTQWLEAASILRQRRLLYIERVEWQGANFLYSGRNLNAGTSIYPETLKGNESVHPERVYLGEAEASENPALISLYPFFAFDKDLNLIYVYNELSNKGNPLLRCFYELNVDKNSLELDAPPSLILGEDLPVEEPVEETRPDTKPAAGEAEKQAQTMPTEKEKGEYPIMKSWYEIIPPHEDIKHGDFDEAIFAADLADVHAGVAPEDYRDAYLFYKKTYPTAGLTNLLFRVHNALANGKGSSVVQIQTPFGGGKTHALVAIYHYLKNGRKIKELLPPGLELLSPDIAVVAGNHWNPVEGNTSEGLTRYTFWGEIAYQIGGKEGYELFRQNDEARISPGKDKLHQFLEAHQPFILLFDEILEYINRALDEKTYHTRETTGVSLGMQTFSFFQELTETVAIIPRGMMVVTLPSSYLEDFSEQTEESLARLNKIFGRLESIETPVQGEEVYAVIRRRLFEVERLKTAEMRAIVHRYFQLYQEHRDDLPPKARDVNYRDKMELAYPFHPDVIDILYEKWSTYPTFQRTRGVLRLLANVIEDLYQREVPLDVILPGDINLDKPGIRQEFLKHIGPEYEGVIGSDIAGHEAKSQALDAANKPWSHLAQRIATAIFFHSFSADDSEKGVSLPYIKLAVLRADTIPPLVTDVLQKLSNLLWYLNSRADAYYFSRIPNLNRMIMDKKELFNETYEAELRSTINKEVGSKFRAYLWPENGDGLPDNRELKLVILHPEDSGARIPEWIERRGESFREYKNTLFFALADTGAFAKLREDVKTYLALQEIEGEIKSGDSPLPGEKRGEVQRRTHAITRDFSYNVRRMYHNLRFGERTHDLGQPTTGTESLSNWYWRELTSSDVGAILTQLHYRVIVNKFMVDNEQLATAILLDQFYKNTELPVPEKPEVVARAIQLGVQDGAFGLVEMPGGETDPDTLKFQVPVPLDGISFEPESFLISKDRAAALQAQRTVEVEGGSTIVTPPGGEVIPPPAGGEVGPTPEPPTTPAEPRYQHIRLRVSGIPASKIADLHRGVLMPINRAVGDFKFTLEIDVSSEEGISQSALENQIKETLRQIGARVEEEDVD